MKRNVIIAAVLGVGLAIMLWYAVREAQRTDAGSQMAQLGAKADGKAAPDFDLKTLDGKDLKLSDLRGKGVLVNFWATYCSPCKVEMPWLADFQKQYEDKGFTIVGVTMDDAKPADIAKFTKDMGVTYPIVLGTDAVGDSYGAQFLPTSVYVDRSGKIVQRVYGLVNRSEIEDNIKKTLATAQVGSVAPAGPAAQNP